MADTARPMMEENVTYVCCEDCPNIDMLNEDFGQCSIDWMWTITPYYNRECLHCEERTP